MTFLQKVKSIMKNVSNSTFYKIMFQCDRNLIPKKNNCSLIERCSNSSDDYKYNVIVRKVKRKQSLLMRSSCSNYEDE